MAKKKKVGKPGKDYRKISVGTPYQTLKELGVKSAYEYQKLIKKVQPGKYPAIKSGQTPYQYAKSIAMEQIGQYQQATCPIFTYANRGGPLKKNNLVIVSMFDRSGRIIDPWREKVVNGKVINKGNICITLDIGAKMYPNWKRCKHIQMDLINGDPCAVLSSSLFGKQLNGLCDVLFAFPPCTNFSKAGTATFGDKVLRDKNVLRYSMNLVDVARNWATHAKFWMIENPSTGSLQKAWRKWDFRFNPHEYSNLPPTWNEKFYDYYLKQTGIWANFPKPPINSIDSASGVPAQLRTLPKKLANKTFTKTISMVEPRPFASQTKKEGNRMGQDQYAVEYLREYDPIFNDLQPVTALRLTKSQNQGHYARSLTPKGFAIAVYDYLTGVLGKKPVPIPANSFELTPMSAQRYTKFKQRTVERNPPKKRRRNSGQYAKQIMKLLCSGDEASIYSAGDLLITLYGEDFETWKHPTDTKDKKNVVIKVPSTEANKFIDWLLAYFVNENDLVIHRNDKHLKGFTLVSLICKKVIPAQLKKMMLKKHPGRVKNPSKKQRRQYHTKADEDKIVQDILDMEGARYLLIENITQFAELLMSLLGIDPLSIHVGIPRMNTSMRTLAVFTQTKREAQKVKTVFDRVARRNAFAQDMASVAGGGTLIFPQVRTFTEPDGSFYTYIRWQGTTGKRVSRALMQGVDPRKLPNPSKKQRRQYHTKADEDKIVQDILDMEGSDDVLVANITQFTDLLMSLLGIDPVEIDVHASSVVRVLVVVTQTKREAQKIKTVFDRVARRNALATKGYGYRQVFPEVTIGEESETEWYVFVRWPSAQERRELRGFDPRKLSNPKRNSAKRRLRRVVTRRNRR